MKFRLLSISAGVAALCLLALPAAALAEPFWPAFPQSRETRSQQQLFWIVVGLAFVILIIVEGLIVLISVRYRARGVEGEPRQVFSNKPIEIWWTAVPAGMLLLVFVLTVRAMTDELTIPGDALPVTVIGHQWWWEFKYPTLDATAVNEMHVPAGKTIKLTLISADVVHNFWIPELAGKEQLIPGHPNTWSFSTDHPATYSGACSEFCGGAHAWMRLMVVADSTQDFDAWIAAQKQPAAMPLTADAPAQQLFNSSACGSCHTIRGTPATGTVGPDLTHVGSRQTLAAGRLNNTFENMTTWIHDAQAQDMKPGSYMPNLHLDPSQAATLAGYLETLK